MRCGTVDLFKTLTLRMLSLLTSKPENLMIEGSIMMVAFDPILSY
jgi:hypothetical protein